MYVVVQQQQLLHALQHVSKAAEAASPLPILAGVLLEAGPDRLSLTASHARMRIEVDIPLCDYVAGQSVRRAEGRLVVPARYLLELVRKLPAGDVTLESDMQMVMTIRSDGTVCRLSGMEAEEFPAVPPPDPAASTFRLPNQTLRTLIRQVSFAASASEMRPVLTGVSCRIDGESLRLLATDGIRMASHTIGIQPENRLDSPVHVVIPGKTLTDLYKMIDDASDHQTEIAVSRNQIRFRNRAFQLLSVLLDGTFPATDPLIPRSHSTELVFQTTPLLQAIERVLLLAGDDRLVKLSTTASGSLRLSSVNGQVGDLVAEVPLLRMAGEAAAIYCNGVYMAELLRALAGAEACIRLSGPMSPIVVQPAAAPSPLYLLTQVRHRETISA